MRELLYWSAASSLMILVVIGLRAVFGRRMSVGVRYALWFIVLLRLLLPFSIGHSALSVENLTDVVEMNSAGAEQVGLFVWLAGAIFVTMYFAAVNLSFYLRLRARRRFLPILCPLPTYSVDNLSSSCLFGFIHPSIYLAQEAAFNEDQLHHVLAHEKAHCRHGDSIWAVLRCLCLALHWYNPLVWVAAVLSRRDAELFADAGAIQELGERERERYGLTLIRLSNRWARSVDLLCTVTTMNGGKRALMERVKMIACAPDTSRMVVLALLLTLMLSMVCGFTGRVL